MGEPERPGSGVTARGDAAGGGVLRLLVGAAALAVLVLAVRAAANFLGPVLVGIWLILIVLPISRAVRRRGWPNWAAVLLPIAILVALGAAIVFFVVAWLASFRADLPEYQARLQQDYEELRQRLIDLGIPLSEQTAGHGMSLDDLASLVGRILPTVATAVAGIGFVILVFGFGLIESQGIRRRLEGVLGADNPHLARARVFVDLVSKAMLLRAIVGLGAALADGALLLVVGVEYVGLWVVASFLCSFIPYVGFWIAMVPPLLLALGEHGLASAAAVFFGYWIINSFFDSIVAPRFQGPRLNLSPLAGVLSVIFWAWVFGGLGGLLAFPLTLGIKVLILDVFPETRWLSAAISTDPPVEEAKSPAPAGVGRASP